MFKNDNTPPQQLIYIYITFENIFGDTRDVFYVTSEEFFYLFKIR